MIIKTESGSRYEIDDHGICRKFDRDGDVVDVFKLYCMKAIPTGVITQIAQVWDYPNGEPEVGKLLFVLGKDVSWLSTEVVSIEA
jgi:hypothetical protein